MARFIRITVFFGCVWFFALPAAAQRDRGELQIEVHDPQGATLSASGELISEGNQFHLEFKIGDDGRYAAQDLAFGVYRVSVTHSGFVPAAQIVEIRSVVPQHLSLTLGLKPIETQLEVSETETLVDPSRTSAVYTIGSQTISEQIPPQAGRGVIDVVDAQPGWLHEANGVLHPRGSEYDVQFVVDGMPLTENRSPGFAPPIESSDVESMRVMTAGFPAEYGRKLGGVVEVTSPKNNPAGLHGEFEARRRELLHGFGQRRSFLLQWRKPIFGYRRRISHRPISRPACSRKLHKYRERRRIFLVLRARFFKWRPAFPDVHATRGSLPGAERTRPAGGRPAPGCGAEGNLRPGPLHARIFAGYALERRRKRARRYALLTSNAQSTPVIVSQDRGYREGYVRADLAGHHGSHEWKIGADGIFNPVNENLQYQITDPSQFDPGTVLTLTPPFSDRRWDIEPSAYMQDQIRLGKWNVSAGLRFDQYRFRRERIGVEPAHRRVAIYFFAPPARSRFL